MLTNAQEVSSQWIAIDERFPDDLTFVLVSSDKRIVDKAWCSITFDKAWFYRDGQHINVTHWMPLPLPPNN